MRYSLFLKNQIFTLKNIFLLLFFSFLLGMYYVSVATETGKAFSLRTVFFSLLGGLGLFLYGMERISQGFQKILGNRLKAIIATLTTHPLLGIFFGMVTTAVVQASSVTTVMLVGMVNSGLMGLSQAMSVILGAHIGTTITAQIIAFRIQEYALPILGLGALVTLFSKRDFWKRLGEAVFGLGVLFFGLQLMGDAFLPLRENTSVQELFALFRHQPITGFFIGALVTLIVQSSSVTSGITIALALSGAISFEAAVPLILGENVGTTVTANIASIGGSRNAKMAARAHFIVQGLGALLMLLLLSPFIELVEWLTPGKDEARLIANAHTFFNIINTLIFLPLIPFVAWLSSKLVFAKRETEELYYLEETALEDPGTALDQVKLALGEMMSFMVEVLQWLPKALLENKQSPFSFLHSMDEKLKRYLSHVTKYLEKIVRKDLSAEDSKRIPDYVRSLHEIERINDYVNKIQEVASRIQQEGRVVSPEMKREIKLLFQDVIHLIQKTGLAFSSQNKKQAREIQSIYPKFRERKNEAREKNQIRIAQGKLEIAEANYAYDIVSALEEITKKCYNIAGTVID